MKKSLFIFILFFLFFSLSAAEKDGDFSVVRKVSDGTLDFTSFELSITGNGISEMNVTNLNSARITAEKAALLNAKQKTAKVLSSLVLFLCDLMIFYNGVFLLFSIYLLYQL